MRGKDLGGVHRLEEGHIVVGKDCPIEKIGGQNREELSPVSWWLQWDSSVFDRKLRRTSELTNIFHENFKL